MKIAISVPDDVFEAAEHLATHLKKSRSQLYSEAVAEYVGVRSVRAVTQKLNRVYEKNPAKLDRGLAAAQFRALGDEAW